MHVTSMSWVINQQLAYSCLLQAVLLRGLTFRELSYSPSLFSTNVTHGDWYIASVTGWKTSGANIFLFFFSDVNVCAHAPVSLHMVGMSSDPEVFSVHINGQVLQQTGHKVSSVGLISGSTTTVSMVALHTGRWLMSSHTLKHIQGNSIHDPKTALPKLFYIYTIKKHLFSALQLKCMGL